MSPEIPVFLNDRPLMASPGTTLGELLLAHEPELLAALLGGIAIATDGRALPVDPDQAVTAGAIFRVRRSARRRDFDDA